MFLLKANIEQFFTKFVEEGKATIRLKEPAVDVCLSKASVNALKTFLSAAKLAHQSNAAEKLPLSTLTPAKASEVTKPKTKLTIMSKQDYPLTKSFPYSLEQLQVSYCRLARVDMRMLCLKKLRKLDLSHNSIKKLPVTIGDLVHLQEFILHDNHMEEFPGVLCSSTLQRSLQSLDLRQNRLKALPLRFCQFQELVQLKLDDNELMRLPFKIGQLMKLRVFSAARNKLPFLPHSFQDLALENLDLFGNPFQEANPLVPNVELNLSPLPLFECAARAVVNYRIPYASHILPAHLCQELDMSKTCKCGGSCLNSFIHVAVTMNLHNVSHTVVLVDNMGGTEAPVICYFCSLECYSQFLDRYLQSNR
uniref:Leucine-rich repeat protein 1 isoform X2 n=1 Tax=Geotrypetes seraphini TaxID=260995 RepID=A0A6P8RU47_GEOSA|nr:leucine-rich repeat protein 1 isoform X2 [Geotrypetes seraphini]